MVEGSGATWETPESQGFVEQLVGSERRAWRVEEVPAPPNELLKTLKIACEKRFYLFEPHYLPPIEFDRSFRFDEKNIIKLKDLWEYIEMGGLDRDAATLKGEWILIDKTPKPNFDNTGRSRRRLHMYQDNSRYPYDPLDPIISRLRQTKRISSFSDMPSGSRFGISYDEIRQYIIPEVAQILEVDSGQVTLPRIIEFNALGNLFYPEWGDTNTREWFADKLGGESRLIGGDSRGIHSKTVGFTSDSIRDDLIGFRLVIRFPSKT